jgi:hypothetical protein
MPPMLGRICDAHHAINLVERFCGVQHGDGLRLIADIQHHSNNRWILWLNSPWQQRKEADEPSQITAEPGAIAATERIPFIISHP